MKPLASNSSTCSFTKHCDSGFMGLSERHPGMRASSYGYMSISSLRFGGSSVGSWNTLLNLSRSILLAATVF